MQCPNQFPGGHDSEACPEIPVEASCQRVPNRPPRRSGLTWWISPFHSGRIQGCQMMPVETPCRVTRNDRKKQYILKAPDPSTGTDTRLPLWRYLKQYLAEVDELDLLLSAKASLGRMTLKGRSMLRTEGTHGQHVNPQWGSAGQTCLRVDLARIAVAPRDAAHPEMKATLRMLKVAMTGRSQTAGCASLCAGSSGLQVPYCRWSFGHFLWGWQKAPQKVRTVLPQGG